MVKNYGFFSKNGCSKLSSEHVDSIWTSVLKLFFGKSTICFRSNSEKDRKKFLKRFLWRIECKFDSPAEILPPKDRNFLAQSAKMMNRFKIFKNFCFLKMLTWTLRLHLCQVCQNFCAKVWQISCGYSLNLNRIKVNVFFIKPFIFFGLHLQKIIRNLLENFWVSLS